MKPLIIVQVIIIILLCLSLFHFPYIFYIFVRVLVCIDFVYLLFTAESNNWKLFWGISAVQFPSFGSLHFGRTIWSVLDIFWALALIIYCFIVIKRSTLALSLVSSFSAKLEGTKYQIFLKRIMSLFDPNYDKILTLYQLNKSAEEGNADSQYKLGLYFKNNTHGNSNVAIKWFELAAQQGHIESQCALGNLYSLLYLNDLTKSLKWYLMASEKGNTQAQKECADLYLSGHVCCRDEYYIDNPSQLEFILFCASDYSDQNEFNLLKNNLTLYEETTQEQYMYFRNHVLERSYFWLLIGFHFLKFSAVTNLEKELTLPQISRIQKEAHAWQDKHKGQ